MRTFVWPGQAGLFLLTAAAGLLVGCGGSAGFDPANLTPPGGVDQAASPAAGANPATLWAGDEPRVAHYAGLGELVHLDGWLPRAGRPARFEWRPEPGAWAEASGLDAVLETADGVEFSRPPQRLTEEVEGNLHLEVDVPTAAAGLWLAVTVEGVGVGSTVQVQP